VSDRRNGHHALCVLSGRCCTSHLNNIDCTKIYLCSSFSSMRVPVTICLCSSFSSMRVPVKICLCSSFSSVRVPVTICLCSSFSSVRVHAAISLCSSFSSMRVPVTMCLCSSFSSVRVTVTAQRNNGVQTRTVHTPTSMFMSRHETHQRLFGHWKPRPSSR
jgi:hypothetical protein